MNAERWRQIEALFLASLGEAPATRSSALALRCGGDSALRADVERMLAAHERASSFIESPAFDRAPRESPEAPESLAAGQRIGHYTVRDVLGAGGMGVVYEAEQDEPRRRVALKVVRALPLVDDLTPRLLRREGAALARLQHPGIAAIYEAGATQEGWHYFAMELVRGTPLTRFARAHDLGIPERLMLFREVCDAVHYAHQCGVIHRDLKPSNILVASGDEEGTEGFRDQANEGNVETVGGSTVDPKSEIRNPKSPLVPRSLSPSVPAPKVLDFGLARITDPDAEYSVITEPGAFQGTLAYASPEQAAGRSDAIDVRSDVYSLGVILYELLSGRLPHDLTGKSLPEAARIIREQDPKPLRAAGFTPALLRMRGRSESRESAGLNPAARLDADLETIVAKALEKDPARRYASVSQLASDITHYLRDEPIAARPASALYHLRKLAVRHKAPFAIAGVALALILGLSAWLTVLFLRARSAEAQAAHERDEAVAARQHEADARASAEEVASFLENLFRQGNPHHQVSSDRTVRDLVEAGVTKLDAELADQPLVHARLAQVLGRVYTQLADYPRARGLVETALATRERELGEAHPDVAKSLNALADIVGRMGQGDRAHALLLKALGIHRAHYVEPHEEVAAALESVGAERFYAGDPATAAGYLQQSLDMRRRLGTEDRLEIAVSLTNLGHALTALSPPRLDEAEAALVRALDIKRRLGRPEECADAISISLTLEAMAHIPYARGDAQTAERYVADQVAAVRRGCPPTHPEIARALRNYAFFMDQNHGPTQAEPVYREVLAIQVAAFGEQHPEVAQTLTQLANVRMDQDDFDAAIELNSRAVEIRRNVLGDDHDDVAYTLQGLGSTLYRAGRFEEAESALLEGYAILTGNHGEAFKRSRGVIKALITLYEGQDQCTLADAWRAKLARLGTGN